MRTAWTEVQKNLILEKNLTSLFCNRLIGSRIATQSDCGSCNHTTLFQLSPINHYLLSLALFSLAFLTHSWLFGKLVSPIFLPSSIGNFLSGRAINKCKAPVYLAQAQLRLLKAEMSFCSVFGRAGPLFVRRPANLKQCLLFIRYPAVVENLNLPMSIFRCMRAFAKGNKV